MHSRRQLEPGVDGVSTHLGLGGGNGGEYRKTYHGFPAPFARLLESPQAFQFTPMQIDTFHREHMSFNVSGGSPFVAGPQPRNSLAKHSGALYSGLLECPLTTRITKVFDSEATLEASGSCNVTTKIASDCFADAKAALGAAAANATTVTGSDASKPVGCSVSSSALPAGGGGGAVSTLPARAPRVAPSRAPWGARSTPSPRSQSASTAPRTV